MRFVIRLHVTFCFNVSCYYFSRLYCKLCWCFKFCLLVFYQLALQAVTTSPIFSNHISLTCGWISLILIYRHTTWLTHTYTSDTTDNTDSHIFLMFVLLASLAKIEDCTTTWLHKINWMNELTLFLWHFSLKKMQLKVLIQPLSPSLNLCEIHRWIDV